MAAISGDAGSSAPLFPDHPSGVWGQSDSGYGVVGTSAAGSGVQGGSLSGPGTVGTSDSSNGLIGISNKGNGLYARGGSNAAVLDGAVAINGAATAESTILFTGGRDDEATLTGRISNPNFGSFPGDTRQDTAGVRGINDVGFGVQGQSSGGHGVQGTSIGHIGVEGLCQEWIGVWAESQSGPAVWAVAHPGQGPLAGVAGIFEGEVRVAGPLRKSGGGFMIDHPQDPESRYLHHSFVESSERKNVYDGIAEVDDNGEAVIALPGWFEKLNRDFRYQLTPLGQPAPDLHIAGEVSGGRFAIAGGRAGQRVCWQVTGVRDDAWARSHELAVEEDKSADDQGRFVHPELYGYGGEQSVYQSRNPRRQPTTSQPTMS
jgi:hypothetical protein